MVFAELPGEGSEINEVFARLIELENAVNNQQQVSDLSIGTGRTSLESFAAVNTGLTQLFVLDPLDQEITKLLSPAGEIPAAHTNTIVSHPTDDPLNLFFLESPSHDGQIKFLHPEDGKDLVLKTGGHFANTTDITINDGFFTIMLWSVENGNKWLPLAASVAAGAGDNLGNHIATIDITGAGAGFGMINVGHFDFIDNLATPVAAISLYSDGTALIANTNGLAGNVFITPAAENLLMNSKDIQEVDRLRFIQDSGAADGVANPQIYVDGIGAGDLVINNVDTEAIIFTHSNKVGLQVTETTLEKQTDKATSTLTRIRQFLSGAVPSTGVAMGDHIFAANRTTGGKTDYAILTGIAEDVTNAGFEGGFAIQINKFSGQEIFMRFNDGKNNLIDFLKDGDFNSFDALNIDRLKFIQDSGALISVGDPTIYVDGIGAGDLVINNIDTEAVIISHSNKVGLQETETTLEKQTDKATASLTRFRQFLSGATPTVGNSLGDHIFAGNRTTGGKTDYAVITGTAEDVGNTTFEGGLAFQIDQAGAFNIFMRMNESKNNNIVMFRDVIMSNNDITGLNAIAFTDAGGQIAGSASSPHMNFVLTGASTFRFTTNAENILDITDAGLTILGTNNIELGNNNLTGVNQVAFDVANITITDSLTGLDFSVPDATDEYRFTIDSNTTLTIEKFFLNLANTRIQMNDEIDPASPAAGDIFIYAKQDSGFAKLFYKQSDGTVVGPLGTGGGGGLNNIVEDITPQLGGQLDANGFDIDMVLNDIDNVNNLSAEFIQVNTGSGTAGFRDIGAAAAPGTPLEGEMYYNTTTKIYSFHNGTSFIGMAGETVTWTQIHDAAGFDFPNVGAIDFDEAAAVSVGTPGIWKDSGGMNYQKAVAAETHDFRMGTAIQIRFDEDGEFLFVLDGHKLVPQATALQIFTSNANDILTMWNGTGASNETIKMENFRTTWRTTTTDSQSYDLQIIQNNDTPQDGRTIGNIFFFAENSSSVDTKYAIISATSTDISNATEDGQLQLGVVSAGVEVLGIDMVGDTTSRPKLGFFGTSAASKPTGVAVTAAGIHAALVTLGLIGV